MHPTVGAPHTNPSNRPRSPETDARQEDTIAGDPRPRDRSADEGRRRAVVEAVTPQVDCGRFAVKRVLGDTVVVEADAFADGHDVVCAVLRHRRDGGGWVEVAMDPLGNDRWRGRFTVEHLGRHEFAVAAWTDAWKTWLGDLRKRLDASQDVTVDLLIGARLVEAAAARVGAGTRDGDRLATWAVELQGDADTGARAALALDPDLDALMTRHADRRHQTLSGPVPVAVDPVRARFSTWYELFPRSTSSVPDRHGTFRDVIARLPYVAGMGFDVLYLPPIHPIGLTFRKGPNNVTTSSPSDPGVPWAIGSSDGGHTAIHPELGSLDDFRELVREAGRLGIQVALDVAFQASPDHPFVREHPTWFRQRPDGTVQYAENPPKKYQDIYPFDFESEDWRGLWDALCEVFRFWIGQGVTIFRVDNPHTKPFPFWEWVIGEIKRDHPEVLFLAEAFTRPKVMYRLGKLGFSQSYTYFTWRNTKWELQSYFEEITRPPVSDFYRANAWPNTPDILHEVLQHGGRAAFQARVALAATLSSNYGIYGPAYELMEHVPREAGSEEYLDSEKYEIRHWDLERADSLAPLIATLNRARREHPALQANEGLAFHPIDDDALLAYTKRSLDGSDVVLAVISLDFGNRRNGTLELPLEQLGLPTDRPFEVIDLLGGSTWLWQGGRQHIELDPVGMPALVVELRAQARTEQHFETYAG